MFKLIGILFVFVYVFLVWTGERNAVADVCNAASFTMETVTRAYTHYEKPRSGCENERKTLHGNE